MTEEEPIYLNTFESIKGHSWRLTRDYAGYKKGGIFMPLDIDYETYHVPFVTFLLNGKNDNWQSSFSIYVNVLMVWVKNVP